MQSVQRILLVIATIYIAVTLCFIVNQGKAEKRLKQWEEIRVETFLQQVIKKRELILDDYICFLKDAGYLDAAMEVGIEIYRRESDLAGTGYYYILSQEEIKETMEKESGIRLEEGSIIQIVIQRNGKMNKYSRLIPGKE